MSINVELNKAYTDLSGHFYQGQTLDDVKEFKGLTSVFYDEKKEFSRIDIDGDGVLSKTEITAELKKDIAKNKRGKIWDGVMSVLSGTAAFMSRSKIQAGLWGIISGLNVAQVLIHQEKQEIAEAKLLEGTKDVE